MRKIFILLCFVLTFLGVIGTGFSVASEKRVLLISSYHPGFPTFFLQIDGIKSALEPAGVALDVEFMDSKRFYTPENINAFKKLLELKLKSVAPYDVVITSDDNALNFVLDNKNELFPSTPFVFCGVNNQELAYRMNANPNVTGVIEAASLKETIDLVWHFFPKVSKLYSISDPTPSGIADLKIYEDLKRAYTSKELLNLSLVGLSWSEFGDKLGKLSSDSAVLLLSAYRDKNKVGKSFEEGLEFIVKHCRVPIFHPYMHGMGKGILGGKVISHFEQGQIAGRIALDIINGASIQEMEVIEGNSANAYVFDRVILDRFNVHDELLPDNAKIINETKSVLKEYRLEILGLSLFISTLIFFSVALLFYYIRLRKTEDKVRESEERFALAMEANKDGIWDWDIQSNDVYYSPGYKAMLGYKADEVPAHVNSWIDLIHEEDRDRAFKANSDCIENRSSNFEVEFRMMAKDGDWRWILGRGNAVGRDENGRAKRLVGTHTDITERKRNENEIRRLRNHLKSIIDSMPFVLIGLDKDARVTQWNIKATELTGVSPIKAVGKSVEEVYPRLSAKMNEVRSALKEQRIHIDPRVSFRDGQQVRYEDITIYPFSSEGENGAVILLEDVTERVRFEDMLVQNEKMLSVGGLAAGMAHEINNPLGAIIQGTQNIQRRAFESLPGNLSAAARGQIELSEVQQYLRDRDVPRILDGINSAALRAAKIVSNMLSFSRKNEDNFSEHDLAQLLDDTVDLAANEYDLTTKYDFRKIEIVREYSPNVPKIHCERSEIQQVFLNILKNGAQSMVAKVDSSNPSKFILRVRSIEDGAVVEIEDNGIGMDKEVRKRIFEPFYTTKEVGEGTGLGLAISYFIITDLHKGSMEVYSAPGLWTRFVITLPA